MRTTSPSRSRCGPLIRDGVDQRAVRGAAVLDRPRAADLLEQRVRARHLRVPGQRDLAAGQPADREPVQLGTERDDPLRVVAVAVLEERGAHALGGDHGLQLGRRPAMQSQCVRSRRNPTPYESSAPRQGAFHALHSTPALARLRRRRRGPAPRSARTARSTPRSTTRTTPTTSARRATSPTAIASHEWLKRKNEAPDYHPQLHAEARPHDPRGGRRVVAPHVADPPDRVLNVGAVAGARGRRHAGGRRGGRSPERGRAARRGSTCARRGTTSATRARPARASAGRWPTPCCGGSSSRAGRLGRGRAALAALHVDGGEGDAREAHRGARASPAGTRRRSSSRA